MSMATELESLLAIDVGSVLTRASLFSVVEGRYRLVATAHAPSSVGPPLLDAREGIRMALDEVQSISGIRLVDETEALIIPASVDGMGVDAFTATFSAGPEVNTVLVGLMPGVSMASARRLASSTYLRTVQEISFADLRREAQRVDLILGAEPDLVLIAGGTDGGGSTAVLRMVETVQTALGLLPEVTQPHVIFAGNRQLGATVSDQIKDHYRLSLTSNIRPAVNQEDLTPARYRLAEVIRKHYAGRILGYNELDQWSEGSLMLSSDAFGRLVRFMSQVYNPAKGVVGIDLGGSHTTVAVAAAGELSLAVHNDLGMGTSMPGLLELVQPEEIMRWLPVEMSAIEVQDFIHNKGFNPGSVPALKEEFYLELAIARETIRAAMQRSYADWPARMRSGAPGILLHAEPILAAGGVLSLSPKPGYAALTLIDALQPAGVSTLVLDPHNIATAMGAAARKLPMLTVQGLGSGGLIVLGTIVAPLGKTRLGRPVLHVQLERQGADDLEGTIRYGQLVVLPLRPGEIGKLTLRPERGFDVGFGRPGKAGALRVTGGAVGVIIDARGRPLVLPRDPERRIENNQKWLWDIGAGR